MSYIDRNILRTNLNLLFMTFLAMAALGFAACLFFESFSMPNTATSVSVGLAALLSCTFLSLAVIKSVSCLATRVKNPDSHPIWLNLQAFGEVEMLARILNAEATSYDSYKFGKLRLTRSWIVRESFFSLQIMPNCLLASAYKKIEACNMRYLENSFTKYYAMLFYRNGEEIAIEAREHIVDAILEAIGRRATWATIGWTDES